MNSALDNVLGLRLEVFDPVCTNMLMKHPRHAYFGSAAKLMRFAVVGFLVMGVFMALNWFLGYYLAEQISFLCAYPPALFLHFYLNKNWTFKNHEKVNHQQLVAYTVTVLVTFIIQWCVFTLMRRFTSFPAWIAAGAANVAQMTFSFLMMKLRVFVNGTSKTTA